MDLTCENVRNTFLSLFYDKDKIVDGKIPANAIKVDGITQKFAFDPVKVNEAKPKIRELLAKIDPIFKKGASFLRLPFDENDNQWGEHVNAQELMVMGVAAEYLEYLAPKADWIIMPGGVPFIRLTILWDTLHQIDLEEAK